MFIFPQAAAETSSYMIAGYVVIFGVMLLYLISLVQRRRSLKEDMHVLQEIQDKEPAQ